MEFSTANNSMNMSNPNRIIDPQFLLSFGRLQLSEKLNSFNQESLSTFNHNADQDSIKTQLSHESNMSHQRNFQLGSNNNSSFQDSVKYGNFSRMEPSYQPYHQFDNMERLLFSVKGSVCWLMVNQPYMFQELLALCEEKRHLNLLARELFSDGNQLVESTFTKKGSISVQKLMKKIKHTAHAFRLTELLATRFYDMATHYVARLVIQKCFNVFGTGPNHVLYIELIRCHRRLSGDILGCNTLNDGIDAISGEYRTVLLDCIAKFSDYLANDPYGNFVVQHVLGLHNNEVNDVILERLKGQFVSLAQKKRGSHVVEKCMKASDNGLVAVVKEMLQSANSLSSVAKDPSGNYIVQKALDMTKAKGLVELYESLVESLKRQTKELERTPGGRHVISFLRYGKSTNGAKCNSSC